MNPRIKQLEDQASQYASRETTDLDEWEFIFRKKFAELIVRECIETMKRTLDTECINENEKHGCMYAIVDVKDHFGLVEDGDVTIKLV